MEGTARANPGTFEERKFGCGIGGAGQQHAASSAGQTVETLVSHSL